MFKSVSPLITQAGQSAFSKIDDDLSFVDILKQEMNQMESQMSNNPYLQNCCDTIEKPTVEQTEKTIPNPTELRISTMTAICNLNISLTLKEFFDILEIKEIDYKTDQTITFPHMLSAQFGSDQLKGVSLKKKKKNKKAEKQNLKKRKCFQNQITFIILLNREKKVNIKLFKNGKIQMTGLKSQEDGLMGTKCVIDSIKQHKQSIPSYRELANFDESNMIQNFQIVLINSDFNTNFMIRRERLFEILKSLGFWVSYEPDIYPGVNAKYYWNPTNQSDKKEKGICSCQTTCDGSGNGTGDGKCRKITIATFKSGAIIITGARHIDQTNEAYQFINDLFSKYFSYIHRESNKELLDTISNDPFT